MQTALILDALRSAQYLHNVQGSCKIETLLLCGHSMGGACAIVAASKLKACLLSMRWTHLQLNGTFAAAEGLKLHALLAWT